MDLVVFGRQAADTTAKLVKPNSPPVTFTPTQGEASIARLNKMRYADGPLPTAALRADLQVNMQTVCPVYRNSEDMKRGLVELPKIMKKYKDVGVKDRSLIWNTDMIRRSSLRT